MQETPDENRRVRTGTVVTATVTRVEVYGVFTEYRGCEILVLIPETSWIASFASCDQFASVGDLLRVRVIAAASGRYSGSVREVYPESNPWDGKSPLHEGETIRARVVRRVQAADRCKGKPGLLMELRPGAYAMLCEPLGDLTPGSTCDVRIEHVTEGRHAVKIARS